MDKTWVPLPMISLASFHWVKLILPLETHQILRFLYHEVNPILTSNSKLTPIDQDLPHMKNLEMRIVLEDKHLLRQFGITKLHKKLVIRDIFCTFIGDFQLLIKLNKRIHS